MGKRRHSWILALSVFIFGMAVTGVIARTQFYNTALQSRQLELVNTAAQELHHSIQSEIQHAVDLVQTTAWLFNASQSVNRAEFREFASHAISNSLLLRELQWRPRVLAGDVSKFIEAARQDGLTEFALLEQDPSSGKYIPVQPRAEYFPVFYSDMDSHDAVNPSLLGVDTAATSPELTALEQGISEGLSVIVTMADAHQVLVQVPVFERGAPRHDRQHLKGFISGRVAIHTLQHEIEQKAEKLDVDIFLLDSEQMIQPILRSIDEQGDLKNLDLHHAYVLDNFDINLPFSLANFDGQLIVHPRPALMFNHAGRMLTIVGAGLAISLLLSLLLYRMLGEQREVKLSQERLDNLTANLPIGVFQIHAGSDSPAHFSFVNAGATELLGVSEDVILGQWQNAFMHLLPEDKNHLLKVLRQAKEKQVLWEGEFRLQHHDGIRWLHARAVPRRTFTGQVVYNGYIEDITERKRIDLETQAQSLFLQQLIDTIPSPLFFKGADSRFLGCNRAYEQEFGVKRDHIVGKKVLELEYLPHDDRLAYQEEDEHVIATGATIHKALSMEFADGKMHQVLYWVSGFKLADGSPGGMVGSIVDITAQREAQQALSVAIDQQKALLDSAPLGIIELRNRVVVQCNRKFERMLGYSAGELIGLPTRRWFSTDESHAAVGALGYEVLRRGETYTDEHQFTRKDGSKFWCRIFGHAVVVGDPESHSVWQFEDITDKRMVEEQLRQARDTAEEATLAKSMFLANMSHEIRTPMNAVIGLAHLALKTDLNPKQRDYLTKIHSAGISLLSVINDILDFSKIESGRMDLESIEFSLDQVLSSVTNTLAHNASDAGLELLFDVGDEVPSNLVGDPLRLGQILLNLVSNAIKFTTEGQIIIRCQVLDHNGEQVKLQFYVIDSGIGMDEETSQRLFQPFTQADGSTTRKYGGTGLGLTICKRLVGLMQGDIWVTSVIGKGSTFTFTAWFGTGHPTRPYVLIEELNDLHVLIVDDNAAARSILTGQLGFLPFKLSYAESGTEAVTTVRAMQHVLPVDLVLMDWKMPGLSGIDAARLIKQDSHLEHVPAIIMVTAYGKDEVRRDCEDLKLEGFLVKPVSQSTLIDTLVGLYSQTVKEGTFIPPTVSYDLSGMRLLVVEDNEINQQVASELLQSVGAVVEIAENGQVALDKLHASPTSYDVVLMDLQMPVMDGYEATRLIRSETRFDALPVIAMTAHATVEERQKCLELGMSAHVTKPIDPDMLYQSLVCLHVQHQQTKDAEVLEATGGYAVLEIEGFNVAEALRRVAGNQDLYTRLLKQFSASQKEAAQEIRIALHEQRLDDAIRLAHTTKGVAGNLGAQALAGSAAGLELALKENSGVDIALQVFESHLDEAITAVSLSLSQQQELHQHQGATLDASAALRSAEDNAALLHKLQQYLENRDADVQDFLIRETQGLCASLTSMSYDRLTMLVNVYDFDEALQLLKPFLSKSPH